MNSIKLILGDSLEILKTLPSNSVHCVVTSPPYWGLRDYGVDGQMGSEPTFKEYIELQVRLFNEVRRVLHPTGTVWLNMGDSYNSAATRGSFGDQSKHGYTDHGSKREQVKTIHAKNRLGQPHRLTFGLQDDGWIWRDEIIWFKTNAMPSSVDDRTTPSHEFVHVHTKKPIYYFDSFAIREIAVSKHDSGNGYRRDERLTFKNPDGSSRGSDQGWTQTEFRNKRSVWVIPTEPFPEAHFATMPTKLAEPCIQAGTSEKGCCPKCLAPWRRVFEKQTKKIDNGNRKRADCPGAILSPTSTFRTGEITEKVFVDWTPGCECHAGDPIPCTVLDPFSGAGTSGLVATRLQRSYIGIELNSEYLEMSQGRIYKDQPIFNQIEIVKP